MEQIILEAVLQYMDESEVIRDKQHSFTKGKFCLRQLVAFYEGVTGPDMVPQSFSPDWRVTSRR